MKMHLLFAETQRREDVLEEWM